MSLNDIQREKIIHPYWHSHQHSWSLKSTASMH